MKKLTFVVVATALCTFAQGPGRPGFGGPGPMMGPGGPPGRTVSGAPYSGVEVTTSQQILASGNVIQNQSKSNVYRDSQGRVRTETPEHRPGPNNTQTATTHVTITDPIAGVVRHVDDVNRVVNESPLHPAGRSGPPPNGNAPGPRPRPNGGPDGPERAMGPGGPGGRGAHNDPNVTTENLGTQTINGVSANGTRVTHTIPVGAIGNAQAIQSVREVWSSPDLKVPVMVKESDPRFGTTVTELTNIVRAEPDATLFQAPAGYTVRQGGPGGPGRPGRGGEPR
jgi:hypothetical protein